MPVPWDGKDPRETIGERSSPCDARALLTAADWVQYEKNANAMNATIKGAPYFVHPLPDTLGIVLVPFDWIIPMQVAVDIPTILKRLRASKVV